MKTIHEEEFDQVKDRWINHMLAERIHFIQLLTSVLDEDHCSPVLWSEIHNALKKAGQLK